MSDFIIYTDGACSGNPGPGGWAAIIISKNQEYEIFGCEKSTTNNRMELIAVINAIKEIREKAKITINTDSKYILDGINKWIHNWKLNNWKTSNRKDVKNSDLWKELDNLNLQHNIKWVWVKAHAGHEYNERADKLARIQSECF